MKATKKASTRKITPVASSRQSRKAFVRHLEQASEVVQKWPRWKQQLLGVLSSESADAPQSIARPR